MTDAPQSIDHADLDSLLRQQEALLSAAELHGYLCGQLAVGRRLSRSEWLRQAGELGDFGRHPDEPTGDALYRLYGEALAALGSNDLDFQLLLVDDDAPLADRLESLGRWCQGFLSGFGLAGGASDAETDEVLRDLSAIAQVRPDDEESDDSDNDLFAVTEYVRLAVVNLFWQKSPGLPAATPEPAPAAPSSPASLFQRNRNLH